MWLKQRLESRKTGAIMNLQEKMVKTRVWKVSRGLTCADDKCRLCGEHRETVDHLLARCKLLAGNDYLTRHNRALMTLAMQWAKEFELIDTQTKWYSQRWKRGHFVENSREKLVWDFEYHLRKTTTYRRPDLTLEDKERKMIWLCNMACPQQDNINIKTNDKRTKYQQLAFKMRERRIRYKVIVVPIIIGCLGRGLN